MNSKEQYDLVVVGGGAIGLATAYHSAKMGKKVLVLEARQFFHHSGSSGDIMRMFRILYSTRQEVERAIEALKIWHKLEEECGEKLLWMTGQLNFGSEKSTAGAQGEYKKVKEVLEHLKRPCISLSKEEIEKEFHLTKLGYDGYFSPDNGVMNVPLILRTFYKLARQNLATLIEKAEVTSLKVDNKSVTVTVNTGETYTAKKCVIACGAHTNRVLEKIESRPKYQLNYAIWNMVYDYYATDPKIDSIYPGMWVFFGEGEDALYYGFPPVPWGPPNLAKIGWESATQRIHGTEIAKNPADRVDLVPAKEDVQKTVKFIKEHCLGVEPYPVYSGNCVHPHFGDHKAVLDRLPEHTNVVVCAGGWSFKFLPLYAEWIYRLTFEDATLEDLSCEDLAINRTAPNPDPQKAKKREQVSVLIESESTSSSS
ncbi:FAD-dependent oxidoreductase [Actinomadura sp. KC216]|uniref:FAD-dependent oxidoreductase n=1 Tax=Actinomadura sp. KC216 TaxID=2530370 RepID=UPI00104F8ADF|nr:FAD-dependent oxidoreductase [Actinomadura sp. KC216]TDB84740.1 FAD-dependent oxidoreductase [Actinomadura sp. KC216]